MLLNKMKVCVCVYVCGGVIRQKYCMQVVCICFLLTVAVVGNRSQFMCERWLITCYHSCTTHYFTGCILHCLLIEALQPHHILYPLHTEADKVKQKNVQHRGYNHMAVLELFY